MPRFRATARLVSIFDWQQAQREQYPIMLPIGTVLALLFLSQLPAASATSGKQSILPN